MALFYQLLHVHSLQELVMLAARALALAVCFEVAGWLSGRFFERALLRQPPIRRDARGAHLRLRRELAAKVKRFIRYCADLLALPAIASAVGVTPFLAGTLGLAFLLLVAALLTGVAPDAVAAYSLIARSAVFPGDKLTLKGRELVLVSLDWVHSTLRTPNGELVVLRTRELSDFTVFEAPEEQDEDEASG